MFFCLSKHALDNFPNLHQVGPLWLGLDQGWNIKRTAQQEIFFKGYADQAPLDQTVDQIVSAQGSDLTGNFCVIQANRESGHVSIWHDAWRSFPIYVHDQHITNLWPSGQQIWADAHVDVTPDLVPQQQHRELPTHLDLAPLTWNQALQLVHSRLLDKTQQFLSHCDRPIKVFLSGGVDTLLVYSYLRASRAPVEIVKENHVEFDRFWMQNSGDIRQHWAYQQIHHWVKPCVLSSGAPGDEFMLRSPSTAHAWCQWHGISILDLLQDQYRDCYHNLYFSRPKHQEIFRSQVPIITHPGRQRRHLCDMVLNDFQHWHLGNTLTWTPLRDLDLFLTLLRLPIDQALRQIMNSEFSRELIEHNCPGLTRCLSDKKNSGNPLANLVYLQ